MPEMGVGKFPNVKTDEIYLDRENLDVKLYRKSANTLAIADALELESTLKLGGTVTLNGQIFDAGAGRAEIDSTAALLLKCKSTQDGGVGPAIEWEHVSASPADGDVLHRMTIKGRDDAAAAQEYCLLDFMIEDATAATHAGKLAFILKSGGAWNDPAAKISGAGEIAGDLAYAEFDELEDAKLMTLDALPVLERIGVVERKNTGSGWMLNFQKAIYLGWGGIRQNRAKLDKIEERLVKAGI